jgi:5'-nucleotidase (lipoprotein e(P4) family)
VDVMKKTISLITLISLAFTLFGINVNAQKATSPLATLQEQNTMSVLWFQTAGEAKALYYQGYNIGRLRLDEALARKQKDKNFKPAVVLDIDETILENSPKYARSVIDGRALKWNQWIRSTGAKPLPGALDFLTYADAKGVAIYYISNRNEAHKAATIKNLKSVGAPQADVNHVLLKQLGEKGKETRRSHVAQTHEIVLLFGDNLGDFSGFDRLTVPQRIQAVEQQKDEFGKKLIVFPNPMYGDWEEAIYQYDNSKAPLVKVKARKENLQFQP